MTMALIVVAGALRGPDGWFVARRAPTERAYPGCWEFPGGKVRVSDVTWCERCGVEKDAPDADARCGLHHGHVYDHHEWTKRCETLGEALVREWWEETGLHVIVRGERDPILRQFKTDLHGEIDIYLFDIVAYRGLRDPNAAIQAGEMVVLGGGMYPTETPVHSCAMYMTPEQMLRTPDWASTPSLHPFARALRDRL